MDTLIGACCFTSIGLGVAGFGLLSLKKSAPRYIGGRWVTSSGAKLIKVNSHRINSTFVIKPDGEICKVKSLGFRGKTRTDTLETVKTLVGPDNIRARPFNGEVVEIKESDDSIFLYEYKNKVIATDDAEVLQRCIEIAEAKEISIDTALKIKKSDDPTVSDIICVAMITGGQYIGYLGGGLAVFSLAHTICHC